MERTGYWHRRGITRRRFVRGAAAGSVLAATSALVGCGDDDDETPATAGASNTPGSGDSTTPAGSDEPVRGGTLQKVMTADLAFDPFTVFTSNASSFATVVYSKLLRNVGDEDAQKTANYDVYGDLARDYEQPDDLTFNFNLRDNAVFQNLAPVNGRPVTADDVILSFEKFISDDATPYRAQWDVADGLPTAIDDHTVQFKTKTPFGPFLSLCATGQFFYIFPKEMLENDGARSSSPVGSGPYQFKNRQETSYWEFARNPDFYGSDEAGRQLPFLDTVRYNVVPEPAQQLAQFLGGNIDTLSVPIDNLNQVRSQVKDVNLRSGFGTAKFHIYPQQREGIFRDPRLRQAVSLAVDRAGLLAASSGGEGGWNNYSGFYEGAWYLDPTSPAAGPGSAFIKFDQAEARKLVEASGITDTIEFVYPNNGYGQVFNQCCTVAVDYLKQIGLNVVPVPIDYRTEYLGLPNGAFFGNYKHLVAGFQPLYPNAYLNYRNVLFTDGPHNSGGASDEKMDALITAIATKFERDDAVEAAYEAQKHALEQLYTVPFVSGATYQAWQPNVKNTRFSPAYSDEEVRVAWKTS